MSRSLDRLYQLLPVVHRLRDAEQGYQLRALLRVINEQVNVVEDDIAQLYENWFIETCEDWVVPYIGELVGYQPALPPGSAAAQERGLLRRLAPRREVAGTLGYRRRKGTLALLEVLASDCAGWPGRAVEFYTLLAWTQHIKYLRLTRARTVDLRKGDVLDRLGGPFEHSARTVDVRRVISARRPGRHNIPSVGLFIWRLRSYPITHAPACCVEEGGPECFTFNILGSDTPLYVRPMPETDPAHIAGETNLPAPIRRRALQDQPALYGENASLAIYAPGWPNKQAKGMVPLERIIAADLSNWTYRAPQGHVAVDPVLGRMVFPVGQLPRQGVWVNYQYGFSADMGGGEYERGLSQPLLYTLYAVSKEAGAAAFDSIQAALARWRADQSALGAEPADPESLATWRLASERLRAAVIEILDSGAYSEPLAIELATGEYLQIRAANRKRPVLRLLDYMAQRPDAFAIAGKHGSRFVLDGLLVTGRGMQINGPERGDNGRPEGSDGDLCDVTLRHVTLVPGWALACDCEPHRPNEASLELLYTGAQVKIEHSILGAIEVIADEVQTDPVQLTISDSIIDATDNCRGAIGAANLPLAFAQLCIARSTVIGGVAVHAISHAENTIFSGMVLVARRQLGCMRYCYVPPGSRTPRRYRCQPETAAQAAAEELVGAAAANGTAPPSASQLAEARDMAIERVRPRYTSTRYGTPAYCQLACDCAPEIARGADDESEMGAFHDLFQPQRTASLRARLDEYTPAGMDAGILFVN